MREGQKHVVLRMHVDAALQRLLREAVALGVIDIVLEQDRRHLRRAALPDAEIVTPRLLGDAVAQPLAHPPHVLGAVLGLQHVDCRERGGHRGRAAPERAGGVKLRRSVAKAVVAHHRRQRIAVGDRLAPGAEIRLHADLVPTAMQRQPETGADIVEDQRGVVGVAQRARTPGESGIGQFLVLAVVMPERGDDDGRQIGTGLVHRLFEAGYVVVVEIQDVRAVLRHHAIGIWRAPRNGAVIGAVGQQHLALPGGAARQCHAGGGRVGAVLGKQRPVGVGHQTDQALGQFDHALGRTVEDVALLHLLAGRGIHDGVAVAEHDGPPAAHEVEILATVDIPDVTALAAGEELRISRRQTAGAHVAIHAAGHDTVGAIAQASIDRAEFGGHQLSCPRRIRIYDI